MLAHTKSALAAYPIKLNVVPNKPKRKAPRQPANRGMLRSMQRFTAQIVALVEANERQGLVPATVPPPGFYKITPVELKVWRRIADDKDEKYEAIYLDMRMTKRNFDKRVNSLFKKLGIHKRTGAVRFWERLGMGWRGYQQARSSGGKIASGLWPSR